jgi:hypothetical protein
MPGATDYTESEDAVSYYVANTLSEVESFYSAQMPALGWTLFARDDSVGGSLLLMYQKDSNTAVVGAVEENDQCFVVIAVS